MSNDTLVVTLYGGPGTGKSTTAALVFGALKQKGYNVEVAHEFAKDLTWEKAHGKLGFQPYVTAKQMWRMRRLEGQVEAIITDTSTLLALIYGDEAAGVTPAFKQWILDDYYRMRTLNIRLVRSDSRPYNASGRNQTEEEARLADAQIQDLLNEHKIPVWEYKVQDDSAHVNWIVEKVESSLNSGLTLQDVIRRRPDAPSFWSGPIINRGENA